MKLSNAGWAILAGAVLCAGSLIAIALNGFNVVAMNHVESNIVGLSLIMGIILFVGGFIMSDLFLPPK
jgi:uncharacterized membrane protein YgdD (TMEM256/DUF423 family)